EEFTSYRDFVPFQPNVAVKFKTELRQREYRGKKIAASTVCRTLRCLKAFYLWLAMQPGLRRKIDSEDVEFFNPDRATAREAASPTDTKFPSLEYVTKLVSSISGQSPIDRRDRALVAFLFLSGMRVSAIMSLPVGDLDCETLEIRQYPEHGVATKFNKKIRSWLMPFDCSLVEQVRAWATYLRDSRSFTTSDPLFPRSKLGQEDDACCFESTDIEPERWRSATSIRKILQARAAAASLEYYPPHSFRHGAVYFVFKQRLTPEEFKAYSQNFGHENPATTMMNYGTVHPERQKEIVTAKLPRQRESAIDMSELFEQFERWLDERRHRITDQCERCRGESTR
ncbi:MAG: tyrosine-type recombinase/integrase, partial [bacterium]